MQTRTDTHTHNEHTQGEHRKESLYAHSTSLRYDKYSQSQRCILAFMQESPVIVCVCVCLKGIQSMAC